MPGEPTEELLYQSRAQQADLIVLGAQGAATFASIARQGVTYKVLAHANCPVMTLPQMAQAVNSSRVEKAHSAEVYLAGVF